MRPVHTLAVAILLVFSAWQAPAATQHSAIKPLPRADTWWKERAKLLDDRLEQTPDTELLFIGDSIMQGWESAGKDVWSKYYTLRKAVNLGVGGDRTQHVLWRLENAPLGKIKPKVAVVMIGTNNSNGDDNTAGQIVEGVAAIVNKLRSRLPDTKILLLAIFPRNENYCQQRGKITQVNQVLGKLADDPMVTYLDIGHKFMTLDGIIPAEIMPDYLHPSPDGYQIWAEAMEPTLKSLLEPYRSNTSSPSVTSITRLDPTGEWTWKMRGGPAGQPMEGPLTLQVEEGRVSGVFTTDDDRHLPIEAGSLIGNELNLTVRRPRLQGGEMVYHMTGTVTADQILGKVTTQLDGTLRTQEWSARRK